jgi:hypothetical protein
MSTQTLSTIKTLVRDSLNESSTTVLSDAELELIIQDGYKDVAVKTMCYEVTKTITLTAGVSVYRIPTTSQIALRVTYVDHNNRGLIKSVPNINGRIGVVTSGLGTPQTWFTWGDLLIIDPPADATSAAVSPGLTLYCSAYPAAVITTTISNIPDEFHESIYEFARAFSALKFKRWGDVANSYNTYIENLQAKRFEYVMKNPDSRSMSEVPNSVKLQIGGNK